MLCCYVNEHVSKGHSTLFPEFMGMNLLYWYSVMTVLGLTNVLCVPRDRTRMTVPALIDYPEV